MSVSFLSSSAENSCRPRWASDGLEGVLFVDVEKLIREAGPLILLRTLLGCSIILPVYLRLQLNESKYFRNFGQKFNTVRCCVVLLFFFCREGISYTPCRRTLVCLNPVNPESG